jgi:hypothetical protein
MIDPDGKFERHDLRLLYCPGMVAAVCLLVLAFQVRAFVLTFESMSGIPGKEHGIVRFPVFAKGLFVAASTIPVILIASAVFVARHGNNTIRILVLIYLLFMFAAILLDFILLFAFDIAYWLIPEHVRIW